MVTKKDKHLAAAQKYLERGSLEKALTEFQNAVKEDAKDTRTWLRMAEVHVRLGQNDKATEVYQKTVDLYVEQGFFQRAVAVYKNIIKLSPEAVEARSKLADVYRQLGLFSDAIQQLEQAVSLHQKAGRISEALTAMKQILDLNPGPAGRADPLCRTGCASGSRSNDAVAEFREAANLLKAQGRTDEFTRVAERILYYQPDDLASARRLPPATWIATTPGPPWPGSSPVSTPTRRRSGRSSTFWPVVLSNWVSRTRACPCSRNSAASTPMRGAWRNATRPSSGRLPWTRMIPKSHAMLGRAAPDSAQAPAAVIPLRRRDAHPVRRRHPGAGDLWASYSHHLQRDGGSGRTARQVQDAFS